MQTTRYSTIAMLLHWLTAAVILGLLIFGEDMVSPREGATDFSRMLHVSLGSLVLLLTLARLLWRLASPPPALPANMQGWEVKLSKAVHHLFYVLLIFLPLSGWLAASALNAEHGTQFSLAGLMALPMLPLPDLGEFYEEVHGLAGNLIWALFGLHVLGALKHQFLDGGRGYLARMGLGRT